MANDKTTILTPVGRIVQGHPMEAQDKNMSGQPLTDKQGNPRVNYFMGVAFPKTDPAFNEMWAAMQRVAQQNFPGGQWQSPVFSWKYIDGDGTDSQGQPYANREGFAGHHVIRFNSGFAPKCYTAGGASQIVDPQQLKRGYYVRVYASLDGNGQLQKPGIYINMNMVELVGYGEEITSGPDGATVFGGAPAAQLPAGASTTPLAPNTPMQHPGMAAPGQYPGAPAPQPGMAAPGQYPGAPAPQPGQYPGAPAPQPGMAAPGQYPGAPAPQPGMAAPGQYPGAPAAPAQDFLNPAQGVAGPGGMMPTGQTQVPGSTV